MLARQYSTDGMSRSENSPGIPIPVLRQQSRLKEMDQERRWSGRGEQLLEAGPAVSKGGSKVGDGG